APILRECKDNEKIDVDFEGVEVLTPSWADEFLTPLVKLYRNKISFKNTNNPSVVESLKILDLGNI
ncbi:STAS-like domain-containing protein, partial [Candidatus Microgenomates bacterium]|nr:STAS-like domain-containing protein [Candidatus Microgenomates bacterium]